MKKYWSVTGAFKRASTRWQQWPWKCEHMTVVKVPGYKHKLLMINFWSLKESNLRSQVKTVSGLRQWTENKSQVFVKKIPIVKNLNAMWSLWMRKRKLAICLGKRLLRNDPSKTKSEEKETIPTTLHVV